MKTRRWLLAGVAVLAVAALAAWRFYPTESPAVSASDGTQESLAPFVPTPQDVVDRMLFAGGGDFPGYRLRPRLR